MDDFDFSSFLATIRVIALRHSESTDKETEIAQIETHSCQ